MAAARRLVWAPAAARDLLDIWRYYVRVASPEIADTVLRDIGRSAELARENPLAWRSRDELKRGIRAVLAHPYTVFFRLSGRSVEIVRVLHERRDFGAELAKHEE